MTTTEKTLQGLLIQKAHVEGRITHEAMTKLLVAVGCVRD